MKKGLKTTHSKKTVSRKFVESSSTKGLYINREETMKT